MNSIKDLINVSEILSSDIDQDIIKDYKKSIRNLESCGYRVLNYELMNHRDEISRMVFEEEISQSDVSFNEKSINITEKALSSLMRRKNPEFEQLDMPVLSHFSGKYGQERLSYYNNQSHLTKQTPVSFLQQKILESNQNKPTLIQP